MRYIYILLFITGIVSSTLWSQEDIHHQLYQALLLEQQGQFEKVILKVPPLIASNAFSQFEYGRAWTLLGYAYKEQGRFPEAQNAYEHSLRILEGDTEHIADYANTLDYFARFYRAIGQQQTAMQMWSKAARIDEQRNNHSGLARIYISLAGLAIEQHHVNDARKSLARAIVESKLTNEMTSDDDATLSVTEAWIASTNGKHAEAVLGYREALKLWKRGHGEEHPLTGWGYLLLGQAYTANNQLQDAIVSMQQGLTILSKTVGVENPKYLTGEVLYSQALDRSGQHVEASQLRAKAEGALETLLTHQCINCSVSTASLQK